MTGMDVSVGVVDSVALEEMVSLPVLLGEVSVEKEAKVPEGSEVSKRVGFAEGVGVADTEVEKETLAVFEGEVP